MTVSGSMSVAKERSEAPVGAIRPSASPGPDGDVRRRRERALAAEVTLETEPY